MTIDAVVFVCPVCGLGLDDCMSPPVNLLEWFDRRQSTFLKYHDKGQGELGTFQLVSFAAHEKHGDL